MLLMKLQKWSMFNYRTQLNEFVYRYIHICIMFFHGFFRTNFLPKPHVRFATYKSKCHLVETYFCHAGHPTGILDRLFVAFLYGGHGLPWQCEKHERKKHVFCLCDQKIHSTRSLSLSITIPQVQLGCPPNLFSQFFFVDKNAVASPTMAKQCQTQ